MPITIRRSVSAPLAGLAASIGDFAGQQQLERQNQSLAAQYFGQNLDSAQFANTLNQQTLANDWRNLDWQNQLDTQRYGVTRDQRGDFVQDRAFDRGVFESDRAFDFSLDRAGRQDFESDRAFDFTLDRAGRADFESDRGFGYQVGRDARQDFVQDRAFDYGVYQDQRNFGYGAYRDAVGDQQFVDRLAMDQYQQQQARAHQEAMAQQQFDQRRILQGESAQDRYYTELMRQQAIGARQANQIGATRSNIEFQEGERNARAEAAQAAARDRAHQRQYLDGVMRQYQGDQRAAQYAIQGYQSQAKAIEQEMHITARQLEAEWSPERRQQISEQLENLKQERLRVQQDIDTAYRAAQEAARQVPQQMQPQGGAMPAQGGRPLTHDLAAEYMRRANGDPNLARQMAVQDGYDPRNTSR